MLPPIPPITAPAPPPLAPPAYVQKYNQVRKALGMPPAEKDVFQSTRIEGFQRLVTLYDRPKNGRRFEVTFDQDSGTLVAIRCTPDIDGLSKKFKENPGPLLSGKDVESILNSLLPFCIPEHDRKNWEIVGSSTFSGDKYNEPYFFPESNIYIRRLVDNTPVIASRMSLFVDAQLGQVHLFTYEEGTIIPQTKPLIPETLARAIAQKVFLEAGGTPEAKCRLVWDQVAWWGSAQSLSHLIYRYEFQLKEDTAAEDSLGVIWSVPVDAQSGEAWGPQIETGGGGLNVPKVTPKKNPNVHRFSFASDSKDAQKLAIAAYSIHKPEPAPTPEKFSCLVTPKRKVYYSWDPKQSKLAFSVDNTKDWFGGVLPEKAVAPFVEWLKTQPATTGETSPK